jgi:hypothetical protein
MQASLSEQKKNKLQAWQAKQQSVELARGRVGNYLGIRGVKLVHEVPRRQAELAGHQRGGSGPRRRHEAGVVDSRQGGRGQRGGGRGGGGGTEQAGSAPADPHDSSPARSEGRELGIWRVERELAQQLGFGSLGSG